MAGPCTNGRRFLPRIAPWTLITGYFTGRRVPISTRASSANHLAGTPFREIQDHRQNMPGRREHARAGDLYNIAPKDGTVIALARAPVIEPLGRDWRRFVRHDQVYWLGSGAATSPVWPLGQSEGQNDGGWPGNTKSRWAGSAWFRRDMYAKILRKLFGLKIRLVSGYPGGAEMVLAVERGELDGRCGWAFSSIRYRSRIGSRIKKIRFLNVMALERSPDCRMYRHHGVHDDGASEEILRFVPMHRLWGVHSRHHRNPARSRRALRKHSDDTMADPGAPRRNEGEEAGTSIMSAGRRSKPC